MMTKAMCLRFLAIAVAAAGWLLAAGPAEARRCETNCLTPGDYDLTMTWGGLPREYKVHVPASYTGERPVALTLDIHGHALSATNQRGRSGQLEQSDKRGFIAVWPQGIANSWNGNGCCTVAYDLNVDDVGFLRAVIAAVTARANVDAAKVYATGWSNGGGMTHRLACEAADVVRAFAPVAHPLNRNDCRPAAPVSVVVFHGTADTTVPYDGGGDVLPREVLGVPLGWQGARQSLAAWKDLLGCSDKLSQTQLAGGSRDETYRRCRGGTIAGLVTVANGQHDLYTTADTTGSLGATAPVGHVNVAEYIWTHVFRP